MSAAGRIPTLGERFVATPEYKALRFDRAHHSHGSTGHVHAFASQPHTHLLRALCQRAECAGTANHNIHPVAEG